MVVVVVVVCADSKSGLPRFQWEKTNSIYTRASGRLEKAVSDLLIFEREFPSTYGSVCHARRKTSSWIRGSASGCRHE